MACAWYKVLSACVCPAMLYGCETWALNASHLQSLCHNDRAMITWICGVKPDDEIPSAALLQKLGIDDVTVVNGLNPRVSVICVV